VHDYFEILGVARDARPTEIRRACCRKVHASHPDVWDGDVTPSTHRESARSSRAPVRDLYDAAIDFVDAAGLVDAMRAAFFCSGSRPAATDPSDHSLGH
jgi:curved DNA-binding protein CbpA